MKKILFLLIFNISFSFSQWGIITTYPAVDTRDVILAETTLFTAGPTGIYRSTNNTASWQQVNNGLNTLQASNVRNIIYFNSGLIISTRDGIYTSTNSGESWVKKSSGITVGSTYIEAEGVNAVDSVLYAGTWSGIYRSTNSAESWQITNISGSSILAREFKKHGSVIVSARNSNNSPVAYKSADGGLNWSSMPINGNLYSAITFFSDGIKLFAGTIHGVWLSTNNGANWEMRNQGLTGDPYSESILRVNGMLLTAVNNTVYSSTNDGLNWVNTGQGFPPLVTYRLFVNGGKILVTTSNGLYQRNLSEITGLEHVSGIIPGDFSLSQNYPNPFNPSTKIRFSIPASANSLAVNISVYDISGKILKVLVDSNLEYGIYQAGFDASGLASGIYFYRLSVSSENKQVYSEVKKMSLIK
jgi:photosystem II stability/assembly factor-like uncharacterized protein